MIESANIAFKALKQNQELLNAQNCQILNIDALQFLASNTQKFNVIFCDPPYQKDWLAKLLPLLHAALGEDGVVYAEAEYALESDAHWQVLKHGKAGNVVYHLLVKSPTSVIPA